MSGDSRAHLKHLAELASGPRLRESIAEFKSVTGTTEDPGDWELEFWHAGYKHGALAMIEHHLGELTVLNALLAEFVDDEPCEFDHHGGCQAHGFLEPAPGERCHVARAREHLESR